MKRKLLVIISLVLLLSTLLCSCGDDDKTFGEFSYNGISLYAFAKEDITYEQAKNLTQSENSPAIVSLSVNPGELGEAPLPSEALYNTVLSKYAMLEVVTKYYVTGEEDQLTKVDEVMGTDLKNTLKQNEFEPFSLLVAKGIIIFDELIDYMEDNNIDFKESGRANVAPFKDIFTYHIDVDGNLVIQTRDFEEIPSCVGGGVGCSYRQDTEQVYDSENKLIKWQTSLGVYTATPKGTLKQGYILEVEFIWHEKV